MKYYVYEWNWNLISISTSAKDFMLERQENGCTYVARFNNVKELYDAILENDWDISDTWIPDKLKKMIIDESNIELLKQLVG